MRFLILKIFYEFQKAKYFYFHEDLKKDLMSSNKVAPITFIIINKETISKYKNSFHYDDLYNYLKNEKKIEIKEPKNLKEEENFQMIENLPKE